MKTFEHDVHLYLLIDLLWRYMYTRQLSSLYLELFIGSFFVINVGFFDWLIKNISVKLLLSKNYSLFYILFICNFCMTPLSKTILTLLLFKVLFFKWFVEQNCFISIVHCYYDLIFFTTFAMSWWQHFIFALDRAVICINVFQCVYHVDLLINVVCELVFDFLKE